MTAKEFHESKIREVTFSDVARQKIMKGVDTVAKAVSATLGPNGKTILYWKDGFKYLATKDGVTVAKQITLADPVEDAGAQILKEVAGRTAANAGDGTTTATIIAHHLYKSGLRMLSADANSALLRLQLEHAGSKAIEFLNSSPLIRELTDEDIYDIAYISSNGDSQISELIKQAVSEIGRDVLIEFQRSKLPKTHMEIVKGIRFDEGYMSPYFPNNPEKMICRLENPVILLSDMEIMSSYDILHIGEYCLHSKSPLVIIAPNVGGEALSMLAQNAITNRLPCVAIKAPGSGAMQRDILSDIAVLTGGTVITHKQGMELRQATPELLGRCDKITVERRQTTILGGQGEEKSIKARAVSIQSQIDDDPESPNVEHYQWRKAQFTGGIASLNVWGRSDLEVEERLDRTEDAIEAVKAAVEDGVCPGGGVAYLRISQYLRELYEEDPRDDGIRMLSDALAKPIFTIAQNSGMSGDVILSDVAENGEDNPFYGWDARHMEFGDMMEKGIIDPAKVVRSAILNAISVSSLLVNTDSVIHLPSE